MHVMRMIDMDTSDDRINAWLEDLEPDEPLAVAQAPYEQPRRWHPLVLGVAAAAGVIALGMGGVKYMNAGSAPVANTSESTAATSPSDTPATVTPDASAQADRQEVEHGPPGQGAKETPSPDGVSALGIADEKLSEPSDELDPYDQTGPGETDLTQHLVRAGNQWITHAGAEEAVRTTLANGNNPTGNNQGAQVHAVQSLPLANIGRIVQVRAWVGDGVRSLWAVPVKDDGTVLATPWLVSSEQRPLIEEAPEPTGVIDKEEAIAILTKAGWTNVEVAASGVHPNIPDVLIVRATGIPPHGKQPVTNVVWLGGSAGSRHLMGV